MNEIGYNTEYKNLQLRYGALQEQYANQVEVYEHLVGTLGPNLKCEYMVKIGQYESKAFELAVEIKRWKRKITLRQVALNKGEKPDATAIEKQLDQELEKYIRIVRHNVDALKKAVNDYEAERLSEEETLELRTQYLDAVKRLHPDINPRLPESAGNLWIQIQSAYKTKQWDGFRFLCTLVDGVVGGAEAPVNATDGMTALKDAVAALEKRCAELRTRQKELVSKKPFIYEEFLADDDEVELRKQEIFNRISALESVIKKYKEEWSNG